MSCGSSSLPARQIRLLRFWFVLPLIFASLSSAQEAARWTVSTFAGQAGVASTEDGSGAAAHFNGPRGIAIDASGQVFVADTFNHTIRKITADGSVSTFAGSAGNAGASDGAGGAARFNSPAGIAIDSAGNLYVADMLNHAIRKITPSGNVSTLAGSLGNAGSSDGSGASALFQQPVGVAVDGSGNVYVADSGNSVIRKITASGAVTTLAGSAGQTGYDDASGSLARFNNPYGIAIDSSGTLYVADTFNHTIRKVTSSGAVSTWAGSATHSGSSDGFGSGARFSGPSAIAVEASSGNVYVTEAANHTLRVISSASQVSTVAGSAGTDGSADGSGTIAQFNAPSGIAVNSSGVLFLSDTSNHTIRKLTTSNGSGGSTPSTPTTPPSFTGVKLVNISTRSYVSTGGNIMIAGFIIGGTESKQVLIRASGPGLTQFGVPGVLDDPVLLLFSGQTQIAQNDDWGSDFDRIDAATRYINGFSWTRGSKDAALLVTLPPGGYTAQVVGKNNTTGVALIEVYECDQAPSNSRLVNISTRAEVRTGGDIMIAGFVIAGDSPKRVFVRVSGPALSDFGLTGVLADPVLTINAGQTQIAQNDDWGSDAATVETARTQTGAFAWKSGSKDAAVVLTLPPGGYTALVSGKNNTTGVALIEVYELP